MKKVVRITPQGKVEDLRPAHVADRHPELDEVDAKVALIQALIPVALDAVGEAVWPQCLKALGVGGRLVSYGATTGARGSTEIRVVFWKQLSILGTTMGSPSEFREVMRLVFAGRLKPVIHRVMPLADAAEAHAMMEAGSIFGKVVLVP